MSNIQISIDLADSIAHHGKDFIFKREVEDEIVKFLDLCDLIEEKKKELKEAIAEAGLSIDPTFKGVIGERVRAIYRTYGDKYSVEEGRGEDLVKGGFAKEQKTYRIDSKKVDTHIETKGEIPDGIAINDRTPVLSLRKIDEQRALP